MHWRERTCQVVLMTVLLLVACTNAWADPYAEIGDALFGESSGVLLMHMGMLYGYDDVDHLVSHSDADAGVEITDFGLELPRLYGHHATMVAKGVRYAETIVPARVQEGAGRAGPLWSLPREPRPGVRALGPDHPQLGQASRS